MSFRHTEDGSRVIIDVIRNGKKTTVSMPPSIFSMTAMLGPDGTEGAVELVRRRAEKGETSSQIVNALAYMASRSLEMLMTAYEAETGKPAMPIVTGQDSIEKLNGTLEACCSTAR